MRGFLFLSLSLSLDQMKKKSNNKAPFRAQSVKILLHLCQGFDNVTPKNSNEKINRYDLVFQAPVRLASSIVSVPGGGEREAVPAVREAVHSAVTWPWCGGGSRPLGSAWLDSAASRPVTLIAKCINGSRYECFSCPECERASAGSEGMCRAEC